MLTKYSAFLISLLMSAIAARGAPAATEPDSTAKTSVAQKLHALIRSSSPYKPNSATESAGTDSSAEPVEESSTLLVLPKMVVKERPLPRDAKRAWLSPKGFKEQWEAVYDKKVAEDGRLNELLNGFTIPFLSPSKAERGRQLAIDEQLKRLTGAHK